MVLRFSRLTWILPASLLLCPHPLGGELFFHRRLVVVGEGPSSGYGISVTGDGDYDGDGQRDVVVGAYLEEIEGTATGAAHLYFGGHARDRLTFEGFEDGEAFGYTVACAGDFNGDGYDDLLISAPDWEVGGSPVGRVFMYFGGAAMDRVHDLVFTIPLEYGRFGTALAGVGDIDRNGCSDIIIGAPYALSYRGFFALFLGLRTPDADPDLVVWNDEVLLGRLGFFASRLGDVNSDGWEDFAVSLVPKRVQCSSDERVGQVWVYYGGGGIPSAPDCIFRGVRNDQLFGFSVSGAGDFNGDGYDDILVGAPRINSWPPLLDPPYENGSVFIFPGGSPPDTVAPLVLYGENIRDGFGTDVCPVGDLDADGFCDIMVGAPENDEGGELAGACYFYLGNGEWEAVLARKLMGRDVGGQFGYCLSTVDRIGSPDLNFLIGAPGANAGFLYESLPAIPAWARE